MKRLIAGILMVFAALLAGASAQSPGDPNQGLQLIYSGSTASFTLSWWGPAGRTYFIQSSSGDMLDWTYLPVIESGSDAIIQWGFTSTAPNFFLRLEYTDIPTTDPFNDDFNQDGISNYNEIQRNVDPLSTAIDTNGLPCSWELYYFGSLGVDPDAFVPWSNNSITNLQAFQFGLNPIDYYNGQTPILSVVSGNYQTGAPAGFVSAPLIVSVTDTTGIPLYEAPVTFAVTSGGGSIRTSSSATAAGSLTVFTDSNGQAQVFFQLPNVEDNLSQISGTAGPASAPAQTLFYEFSDESPADTYLSPFAPSNILGFINADGSETISWQNNDAQSPIYVYEQQPDGSWIVVATLSAGATTYTAPASSVGAIEIGNNFSPGGSTGATSGSGKPGGDPFAQIPVQNYAVIDVSGTMNLPYGPYFTDGGEGMPNAINVDDSNLCSFPVTAEDESISRWNWTAGALTNSPALPADYFAEAFTTSGLFFGQWTTSGTGTPSTSGFTSINGANTTFAPPYPYFPNSGSGPGSSGGFAPRSAVANGICGSGFSQIFNSAGNTVTFEADLFGAICYSGAWTIFDPSHPSGANNNGQTFLPIAMNNNGKAIGWGDGSISSDTLWNGSALTYPGIETMEQINDQSQVIGQDYFGDGMFYESGTTGVYLRDLLPAGYKNAVSQIAPISLSNQAADGSVNILFTANSLDSKGNILGLQTYLWTRDGSGKPHLAVANLGNSGPYNINKSGLISAIGPPPGGSGLHALLLVPVSYQQVYPNSGFDWVSQPNWLMVPVSGSNQAIATMPTSMSSNLTFSIQPPSSTTTVSSATLSSTSQLLTVHGTTVGETSAVTPGAGIAITGTVSGLQIDVKPMLTATVAIHAVTQHYTTPMALLPGMVGTPGEICVRGTGVLWSTPTSPDTYGSDGSLTIITGPTGVCHTPADSRDVQVIPVGQAIPADIAPFDTPSNTDLQTYLDQVFGTQANVYFTVTRSDFTVDFDEHPKDGMLDAFTASGIFSPEEKTIVANATSGIKYNVYYVKDFIEYNIFTNLFEHNAAGITKIPLHTSFVRDVADDKLNVTAHEIGHLLGLLDTNDPGNPRTPNPAYANSPSDSLRLMYYIGQSGTSPTLLIKPEWDVINPNPPPQ